ncbi:MAG: hypothetical protein DYG89_34645 [Caldilinea sp. CFX5]|nr:hypothetical protein [Caldilinea sp. CFX5]
MKQPSDPRWEEQLQSLARTFPYPSTPDLAGAVERRLAAPPARPAAAPRFLRPVWVALLALALLLGGLLAVPPVRAALQEWLQIGAVRIWLVEPTATPTPQPKTPTPRPTPTPLASLFDLAGATTLADAQQKAGFPLRLPSYPTTLGRPDGVFYQNIGGPAVVLVWLDIRQPARAKLSLHILGPNTFAEKGNATRLAQTTVNGQPAFWTEGPYMLVYHRGTTTDYDIRRLVEGHVLIWTEGNLTYRLETDTTMTEAVRMAESLVTLPPSKFDFTGKTTLTHAQAQVGFPLRLPAYPADLGAPDHVFVQETNGWFVVLLWMEPADPEQVRLVLYEVGPGVGLEKSAPPVLRETVVKGRPAVWIEGIHYLEHRSNGWRPVRMIDHDVFVWSEEVNGQEITYRLESALPAAEAIRIAESLHTP